MLESHDGQTKQAVLENARRESLAKKGVLQQLLMAKVREDPRNSGGEGGGMKERNSASARGKYQ